jgi:hypothetical protein
MKTTQQTQPIVEILSRVAHELTDIAKSVDHLHCLVENIDGGCIVERSAFMQSAQSIDIVEQRLSGLSHYITELAELMPAHWEVEGQAAVQKLKLSRLAARLSCDTAHEAALLAHPTGDLEFF